MLKKNILLQQKNENSQDDSDSSNRWLLGQINSMKKKIISNSLYKKQENQELQEQQSEEEVKWVKVKRKSVVWKYFYYNKRHNKAICMICQTIYQLGGKSTTIMLYHLRTNHPEKLANTEHHGTIQKISKPLLMKPQSILHQQKVRRIKNISQISQQQLFASLPLHFDVYDVIKQLQSKLNYNTIQSRELLGLNFWGVQNNMESMLNILKKNKNIVVLQTQILGNKNNICLISRSMCQNFLKYKETVSLWYLKKPLHDNTLSMIYIITQDKNIEPHVAGIILLFKQNEVNNLSVLEAYFEYFNYRPSVLIVCGPDWLRHSCETMVARPQQQDQKIRIIHLSTDLQCLLAKQSLKKYVFQINVHLFQKTDMFFIGFGLSVTFINKIAELTPIVLGRKVELILFLRQLFFIMEKQTFEQKYISVHQTKNKNYFQEMVEIYPELTNFTEIILMAQSLYHNIFKKILFTLIYGSFNLISQEVQKNVIIFRQIRNMKQKSEKVALLQNKWVCTCSFHQMFGIPCPHLINVLNITGKSIMEYISPRWLVHYSGDLYMNKCSSKQHQNVNKNKIEHILSEFIFLTLIFE